MLFRTTVNTKKHLRKQLLIQRQNLPHSAVQQWSEAITSRLMLFPLYQQCDVLLTFIGSKDNEVETLPVIEQRLALCQKVLVPVVLSRAEMEWRVCNDINTLQRNQWGILEPPQHQSDSTCTFTVNTCCLVPGIAFSPEGHRIGYGGGFYDKFLTNFPGHSIGLCYDVMLQNTLPVETHDIPVNWIITESHRIECTL